MLPLPPLPPSADVLPMESPPFTPPMVTWLRLPTRTLPRRSPARPDVARVRKPPSSPRPPVARPATALAAGPVSPDVPSAFDWAPELALDFAAATAWASPVRPESPVLPVSVDVSGDDLALIVWLSIVPSTLASPVVPVLPELPEMATGLASAVEVAGPVSPVLVADDWAIAAPESPLIAVGDESSSASPPSPPFALTSAMESPPARRPTLTRLPRPVTAILALTSPARPDLALPRNPPTPPLPPIATPRTSFSASPVSPDFEFAED